MRILAIRGENLASLAGRFEVDFESGPLARAGVFAITGPTGAGKTTLLDAMCLALFDKTPRLDARGGVEIGAAGAAERLRARDVRGMLRRGASKGRAQVDFEGVDGGHYRATWEVRRARGEVAGRLQPARVSLEDLGDGSVVGDNKTDTLEAIEARLGLSFDQFRRSVLLAQGEFAAFLKSDVNTRAGLLERMTGTAIYRHLSVAAFERARDETQALRQLRDELVRLEILDEAARTKVVQMLEGVAVELAERERVHAALDAAVRWWDVHARLADSEREAGRAAKEAATVQRDAEPRRVALARARTLAPLRPLLQRSDDSEQEVARADALASQRAEDARQARVVREDAVAAAESATRRADEAEALRVARAPELDRAAALEERLADSTARAHESVEALESARARLAGREAEAAGLDEQRRSLSVDLARSTRALAEEAAVERVARDWAHWGTVLDEVERLSQQVTAMETTTAALQESRSDAAEDSERANEGRSLARMMRRNAARRLERAELAAAELPDADALWQRRDGLDSRARRLAALESAAEDTRRARASGERARARVESAQAGATQAERTARSARRRRDELPPAIAEADRARQNLEAVRALIARRHDLVDGEPCPLCGADAHPHGDHAGPADEAVDQARARVDELNQARADAEGALAAALADVRAHQATAAQATTERGAASQLEAESMTAWADAIADWERAEREPGAAVSETDTSQLGLLGAALAPPDDPLDGATGPWLWARRDAIDQARLALDEVQARVDAAQRELDERRGERDRNERAYQQARQDADAAKDALADATRELAVHGRALEVERASLQRHRAALDEALPEAFVEAVDCAEGRWDSDALEAIRGASERWRAAEARRRAVDASLAALEVPRAEAEAELRHTGARVAACTEELRVLEAAVATLGAELRDLVGDRSVAEHRHELDEAVRVTIEAAREAARARETAETAAARAKARLDDAQEQLARRTEEHARARAALGVELDRHGVDEHELRAVRTDADWIRIETAALARISELANDAAAVVRERRERLAEHDALGMPERSREHCAAERERIAASLESARETGADLRHRIERDDRARVRAEELGPAVAEQEARSRVWLQISEAIGSASGTAFQRFAQSLTLDLLLFHANGQLRQLKPRYSLQRVPGEDLELQLVDHDLGDEVRSIHGLSGGEQFLVSLALALGLASLSAEQCQIESLFIDEGFGSLDAESLDVALDALDAVQASGRQIGLISHVPGLAERVGAEVRINPVSSGRSRIRVVHAFGP